MRRSNGMFLTAEQSARLLAMSEGDRQKFIKEMVEKIRKRSNGRQPRKVTPAEWSK